MKPIFCGNFDYEARQSDVEWLFRRYGKVDRVDMKSGFAFIYMEDERDADDAIRALDRSEFGRKGCRIRVEWTKQDRGMRRPMGSSRRSSANTRPSKTLFVINFDPHYTRPKDLERHFDSYGKISNVRIRKNFAFVQYEFQEDATKALEATNMSKLMDRVISVEYAVRDDDEHKSAYTPDRNRDRSPDRRSYDRRRSPSPYGQERGSPDYGHGPSRSPYRKEKASPDYGRGTCGRSPSPYRRKRTSPNYGRGTTCSPYCRERSRSPHREEMASAENGRAVSPSPYCRERASTEIGRVAVSRSPYRSERASDENGRAVSRSPYRRERLSPDNGVEPTRSPSERERRSTRNGCDRTPSPYRRDKESPDNGLIPSPDSKHEPRDSPAFDGGAESPSNERHRSHSPPAEED